MSSGFGEMAASHSTATLLPQNRKSFGASAVLSQTHCPRILQVSEAGLTLGRRKEKGREELGIENSYVCLVFDVSLVGLAMQNCQKTRLCSAPHRGLQ